MPKFIPSSDIEAAAQQFLQKHNSSGTVPIPIEEMIEFSLSLNIIPVPGLLKAHSIDGFQSIDEKTIYIDQDQLEFAPNRARFTFAHEVGHIVLHSAYLSGLKIQTIEEWKKIVLGKGTGHDIMETQANMFASFLLMPTADLKKAFAEEKKKVMAVPDLKSFAQNDEVLAPFIAKPLSKRFDVSVEAAQIRLTNWIKTK